MEPKKPPPKRKSHRVSTRLTDANPTAARAATESPTTGNQEGSAYPQRHRDLGPGPAFVTKESLADRCGRSVPGGIPRPELGNQGVCLKRAWLGFDQPRPCRLIANKRKRVSKSWPISPFLPGLPAVMTHELEPRGARSRLSRGRYFRQSWLPQMGADGGRASC